MRGRRKAAGKFMRAGRKTVGIVRKGRKIYRAIKRGGRKAVKLAGKLAGPAATAYGMGKALF
jgi:hypothetical protein